MSLITLLRVQWSKHIFLVYYIILNPYPLAGNGKNFSVHRYQLVFISHLFIQLLFFRNECAPNPVMFFAILSNQRSGSGWFETLLNSHINVSSNGEIFSVRERRQNASSILQTLDRVYNLDWLSSASKNECSAAVGFKWMLNQVYICTSC